MNMNKIIKWIKSLFVKEELVTNIKTEPEVKPESNFNVAKTSDKKDSNKESFTVTEEIKPKKKKRGRPRKKQVKKEEI